MEAAIINTLELLKGDVANGKRTLKNLAAECRYYELQATDDYSKAIFARLSDCTTRKEFNAVFASI